MAITRASAPDGIEVKIYLLSSIGEQIGHIDTSDFYTDMEVFLSTPYIHNNKKYSNWNAYNFQMQRLDNMILTKDNIYLFEGNAAYTSQSGYMEFRAQREEAFSLSLQYGQLSSLYSNDTVLSTLPLTPGALRIGYDAEKALLFWDSGSKRLPFSAVVNWDEILNKPNLALQEDVSTLKTLITNTYLPFSGGVMIGEITLGQGDGKGIQLKKDGRINATDENNSTTCTVLGMINGSTIVGHSSFNTTLRGKAFRPTYNAKPLALYSDILNLVDNENNSFTLKNADSSVKQTWTAQNYYPTSLTWDTDTTKNITGTITLNNESTVSVSALPEATDTSCGIITIDKQVIKGTKNFIDPINLNDKATLEYNPTTNSLDFSFI